MDRNMICLDDFEKSAKEKLLRAEFSFYAAGTDDEVTLRDCGEAFSRYRLRPRILRNVSTRDLRTSILGQTVAMPIGISPTAIQGFAHMDKEIGTAIAAAKAGVVMGISIHSTSTIEDIAKAAPSGNHWMQLQFMKNPRIAETVVLKAEAAGFKALVVTCDMPVLGKRKVLGLRFHPRHIMVNLDLPGDAEVAEYKANGDDMLMRYGASQFISPTWEDVRKLKQRTKLPLVAKGVTTAAGAIEAIENGADAIFVSAHGGRQLDGVRAPIDALSEVVKAVKHTGVEIYLDGGVRNGSDVFKALALGANAVFLGRPVIWGLAHDGTNGVSQVLDIIRDEFSRTMALMGCSCIRDIQPSMVIHESEYLNAKL
ncbi:2-Hydroxyacid oxidase 1-like [Amphiura filiformis]|uniref:2-Hydroxyacid oxidase 1-like n=1 Tax=Amphiura filiformis TaxID=82378 RepID=UPI003B2176F5